MASYIDLRNLATNESLLQNRVEMAVVIAASGILTNPLETSPERIAWAQQAVANPEVWARRCLYLLLAADNAASIAQINGAGDPAIQTRVDAVVDSLARGLTLGA